MRKIILFFSILFLWTCGGGGGDKATGPEEPPIVINLTSLEGQAQKGPFNNGTAINIAELTSALSPTGRNFSSAITNNAGRFSVANVQLESPYVELRANGYYFNEVSNEISSGQLTLFALSNLTGKTFVNVNIITHLEKNRMASLIGNPDNPKAFAAAKLQAQEEVFAIFDYSRANVPESELLDISQGGAANGKLLAMSAIIQGDLTVGQMSELLANISTDIAGDGTLDDASLRNTLITNAANLDFAAIRNNLVVRYVSLGMNVNIPDFETEINQFLKPPVVQDMSLSTDEDTAINITLAGSDPEGESITYSIIDDSNNATVTINGNVANYVPDTHFNGTDTFTYKANDGTSYSNLGTVTVTVNPIDDEPNTTDISVDTDEDTAVDITLTADEFDGDNYSFSIISNPSNGTVSLSGTTATYTPNQDWNGTDTFAFEATDDRMARTNVATATITVNAVNDAPIANDITGQITDENRMMQLDITLDATDIEGDALTYSVVTTNNGSVTINNAVATYVPNQDWNGTDTFTYHANDGSLDSNVATVTITVNAVNDAPITSNRDWSSDSSLIFDEDTSLDIDLSDSTIDVDGDDLTYSASVEEVAQHHWTISLTGSILTITPNPNYNGSVLIYYTANDGTYNSNESSIFVNALDVNDAPVALDTSIATRENVPVQVVFSASDVDGDNLTYSILTEPSSGAITTGDDINFVYTPNNGFVGSDTFTYVANDGNTNSNTSTVSVTVISGSAPIALTGNFNITYSAGSTEYTMDLSSLVTDPDGDPLTYFINSQPDIGSATIDGSIITYTIDESQIGNVYSTSMTFYANDGAHNSNVGTLNIEVDYTLGGYIVNVSEFDHDAYTSNFSSGLRTADVSYLGNSNAGSTGFFIGSRAGEINAKRYVRDFDRFDYWQDEYSVELNFNETSLAWDYLDENIVGFVPFSIYIIHNETGDRIRLFAAIWDHDESGTWTINTNGSPTNEPVYDYVTYESIYAFAPSDINAPYDPNKIAQYSADNDITTSGGCGWGSSGSCNFPSDYLPFDENVNYPFVTALFVSHKDVSNVSFSMITPTASNHTGLNTGYTTGSAIFFKTERNNSRESSKNLGPIFIESTIDDGFDDYEYIEK